MSSDDDIQIIEDSPPTKKFASNHSFDVQRAEEKIFALNTGINHDSVPRSSNEIFVQEFIWEEAAIDDVDEYEDIDADEDDDDEDGEDEDEEDIDEPKCDDLVNDLPNILEEDDDDGILHGNEPFVENEEGLETKGMSVEEENFYRKLEAIPFYQLTADDDDDDGLDVNDPHFETRFFRKIRLHTLHQEGIKLGLIEGTNKGKIIFDDSKYDVFNGYFNAFKNQDRDWLSKNEIQLLCNHIYDQKREKLPKELKGLTRDVLYDKVAKYYSICVRMPFLRNLVDLDNAFEDPDGLKFGTVEACSLFLTNTFCHLRQKFADQIIQRNDKNDSAIDTAKEEADFFEGDAADFMQNIFKIEKEVNNPKICGKNESKMNVAQSANSVSNINKIDVKKDGSIQEKILMPNQEQKLIHSEVNVAVDYGPKITGNDESKINVQQSVSNVKKVEVKKDESIRNFELITLNDDDDDEIIVLN